MSLSLKDLTDATHYSAAIRCIVPLQPIDGVGGKVFPPTYPGADKQPARHVLEIRRHGGKDVLTVQIDSVQSQANRMEEALAALRADGKISVPALVVDFSQTLVGDIGKLSTFELPHRAFDAIVRDSQMNSVPTMKSDLGKALIAAKSTAARALYDVVPAALLFGAWNSTGDGGGLGAKFPRAIVSEITGFGVAEEPSERKEIPTAAGRHTSSRIDPLGIRAAVKVYKGKEGWVFDKKSAPAGSKEVRPSEINHSNIAPSVDMLGVSCDSIDQRAVLSFAALRRLRLDAASSPAANNAMRTVLAALGLVALLGQQHTGWYLRSRCDLVPDPTLPRQFQLVATDGTATDIALTLDEACALLAEATAAATKLGAGWRNEDVILQPQDKLVKLVEASRAFAMAGETDAGDGVQ